MSDPISSGAGKVAEEMIKEVQSAMRQAGPPAETPTAGFNEVLDAQRTAQVQETNHADMGQLLRMAREAQDSQRVPEVPAIAQSIDSRPLANGLQRIMEDVMQGQNKLEEIINLSLSGRNFSTPELLAMQAGVYRFTQELELTSKVVEKATSTIKQTMNTQV